MVFDTDAEVSIINERVYNALNGSGDLKLAKGAQNLKVNGNNEILVLGKTNVTV